MTYCTVLSVLRQAPSATLKEVKEGYLPRLSMNLKQTKEGKMKKVTYCLIALPVTLMVDVAAVEPSNGITSLFFG